ncbi:hypothetical protein L915_13060 [Phytophthora nicotianae]|uniref:Uncharacterized protein n=1 Tax=Phytophthora nicotianae TaxID=4792 RepID=W2GEW4_PHYNI|nr:hypothetical protein L915_13060 [Phytophthora nicotianae]
MDVLSLSSASIREGAVTREPSTMEPPSFFSKYSILLMRAKKSFGG